MLSTRPTAWVNERSTSLDVYVSSSHQLFLLFTSHIIHSLILLNSVQRENILVKFLNSGIRRNLLLPEMQLAHVWRDVRLRGGARQGVPDLWEVVAKTFDRRLQEEQLRLLVHRRRQVALVAWQRAWEIRNCQEDDGKTFSDQYYKTIFAVIELPYNYSKIFKNEPILASLFIFVFFSHYNFNNTNWKKSRWCAWDLKLGPQDGRRRQSHGAMAATPRFWCIVWDA